jgi:hypothetical protein
VWPTEGGKEGLGNKAPVNSEIRCYYDRMNAEAFRKLLNVRPFEVIGVELTSGQVFTIKHLEAVIVLKKTLIVADPETETVQWATLVHVVAVRRRQDSLPEST